MENKPAFILFKFASRSRPDKFKFVIENLMSKISDKENYRVLVSVDYDDKTMPRSYVLDTLDKALCMYSTIFGTSKSKVEAINRDIKKFGGHWDIIVNISDDNEFIVDGFDDIIRKEFEEHYPDFNGCIWHSDLFTHNRICTQSIVGSVYFDTVMKGEIYNNEYISLYCDNEFTEVAQQLNKITYFDQVLCRHNHVANVGGVADEQLKRTESFYAYDEKVYQKRKANNFYL